MSNRHQADPGGEATDLLRQLIANRCVNDGSIASGQEWRNADLLAAYIRAPGLDMETYEPRPGRKSLVARLEGTNPAAPALMLLGHTDVVPASAHGWREDPFGGALVDGWIWGRGALDMLGQTAAMAVALRGLTLAPRLPGTVIFAAVADEESMGTFGARWLWENQSHAVRADYVLGESGGFPLSIPGVRGWRLPVMVAERGVLWYRLRISGTPGHASMPLGSDNALKTAAEAILQLISEESPPAVHPTWRRFVDSGLFPAEVRTALLDPATLTVERLGAQFPRLAKVWHAATHATVTPTVIRGGTKTNVIPDQVELQVDARFLPGQSAEEMDARIRRRLDGLSGSVRVELAQCEPATESPVDTPLWDAIADVCTTLLPDRPIVPFVHPGITDARFPRTAGATAYGAGLFSDQIPFEAFYSMLHGTNERIDQESLRLSTEFYRRVPERLFARGGTNVAAQSLSKVARSGG